MGALDDGPGAGSVGRWLTSVAGLGSALTMIVLAGCTANSSGGGSPAGGSVAVFSSVVKGASASASGRPGSLVSAGSGRPANGTPSAAKPGSATLLELEVIVTASGGPLMPNGQMALQNAPVAAATVTATDAAGAKWNEVTGPDGVAAFRVPAGIYSLSNVGCGVTRPVVIDVDRTASRAAIHCEVP